MDEWLATEPLDAAIVAKACAVQALKDELYHLERELVALIGLRVDRSVISRVDKEIL
ncbi:MAG: hypothetical protein HC857_16640 [Synechococcales cyanobacterium RU_4_20]|nr:hypothetical protein [Synechococcales cyanobacterium RU_4_20]NJR70511.1 hypothetical protein [Synechococcales cyanobacterium CRU_2_2]